MKVPPKVLSAKMLRYVGLSVTNSILPPVQL